MDEFAAALRLMRSRDPQLAENGFESLRQVAWAHVAELIEEYRNERADHGQRCWLLELIGEARSDEALDLLSAELYNPDAALSRWAARGLETLDTKDARRALWQWRQNRTPWPGA